METIKAYLTKEGWKRDWEQTKSHLQDFGKMLYDVLGGNVYNRQHQDRLLVHGDRVIHIRPDRIFDFRLDSESVVVIEPESGLRDIGRPDLAYPHIYVASLSQPLETRINHAKEIYR